MSRAALGLAVAVALAACSAPRANVHVTPRGVTPYVATSVAGIGVSVSP